MIKDFFLYDFILRKYTMSGRVVRETSFKMAPKINYVRSLGFIFIMKLIVCHTFLDFFAWQVMRLKIWMNRHEKKLGFIFSFQISFCV